MDGADAKQVAEQIIRCAECLERKIEVLKGHAKRIITEIKEEVEK